jgi:signal recognition particle receptor subunit beta
VIRDKLRVDHRGELQSIPTSIDPTTSYELLPIELGQVNGLRTQLHIIAVPGSSEHVPTRKQLLDHVDGIVFVVDSRAEHADANLASLQELRDALDAYGRSLDEIPVVVQYNKRDLSDSYAIEALHRRLDIPDAAVFEAVSSSGKGVLQTLTTISKRVIRVLRESELEPKPEPEEAVESEAASDVELMELAILDEGEAEAGEAIAYVEDLDATLGGSASQDSRHGPNAAALVGADLEIVSLGQPKVVGRRALEVPIVLGTPGGATVTLRLSLSLDPLLDGDG